MGLSLAAPCSWSTLLSANIWTPPRRQSQAIMSAVLAAAFDAIITIDHRGVVVEWNSAAERPLATPAQKRSAGEGWKSRQRETRNEKEKLPKRERPALHRSELPPEHGVLPCAKPQARNLRGNKQEERRPSVLQSVAPPDRSAPRSVAARRHFFAIDAGRGAGPNQQREMSTAPGYPKF